MNLAEDLSLLPWERISRIHGNAHSSYIGAIVDRWLQLSKDNYVLDSGPSYANKVKRGVDKWGACDAVFCKKDESIGVLEVEGTRYLETIRKFGKFFNSGRAEFRRLEFAIILLYPTGPKGRGSARQVPSAFTEESKKELVKLSTDCQGKEIVVLELTKCLDIDCQGARSLSHYYHCRTTKVTVTSFQDGTISAPKRLWPES